MAIYEDRSQWSGARWRVRHLLCASQRAAQAVSLGWFKHVAAACIVVLAAWAVGMPCQEPPAATPAEIKAAAAKLLPEPTVKHKPSGAFTITFDNCRSNDKGHVTCQWTDAHGVQHWTYLAGLTADDIK